MPAKKKPATKKPATKVSSQKGKAASKRATSAKRTVAKQPNSTTSAGPGARAGDLIVIESEKVGSPPREGEVLEIVQGQISVSYLVRWQDGHQSLIAPKGGNTRIVPSRGRR